MSGKTELKMKTISSVILTLIVLTACGGARQQGGGRCQDGVCIDLDVVEPILFGEPVVLLVTVTSDHDIAELDVTVKSFNSHAISADPETWQEPFLDAHTWPSTADWLISVEADTPTTFTRPFQIPLTEGSFDFAAYASVVNELRIGTMIAIDITHAGGIVYRSGTPIPTYIGPLPMTDPDALATLIAQPTRALWPSRTPPPLEAVETPAYPYPAAPVFQPTSPYP